MAGGIGDKSGDGCRGYRGGKGSAPGATARCPAAVHLRSFYAEAGFRVRACDLRGVRETGFARWRAVSQLSLSKGWGGSFARNLSQPPGLGVSTRRNLWPDMTLVYFSGTRQSSSPECDEPPCEQESSRTVRQGAAALRLAPGRRAGRIASGPGRDVPETHSSGRRTASRGRAGQHDPPQSLARGRRCPRQERLPGKPAGGYPIPLRGGPAPAARGMHQSCGLPLQVPPFRGSPQGSAAQPRRCESPARHAARLFRRRRTAQGRRATRHGLTRVRRTRRLP